MNYRHVFHAGSFADVFKHVILIGLIRALCKKEKPFCYIDTHAGVGIYDLMSETASKTREFTQGVQLLMQNTDQNKPEWVSDYLKIINSFNPPKNLRFYPGSPRIVRTLLRPQDQMILTELHKEDVLTLKEEFKNDKQVAVHHLDGYQAVKAFLPPKEHRGLLLMDPPYEKTDEFDRVFSALDIIQQRWSAGIYAIWYPIKDRIRVNDFYQQLKYSGIHKILFSEISVQEENVSGLRACGMMMIHPPWQFDETLSNTVSWLWSALSPQQKGECRTEWLVTE